MVCPNSIIKQHIISTKQDQSDIWHYSLVKRLLEKLLFCITGKTKLNQGSCSVRPITLVASAALMDVEVMAAV